MVPKLHGAGQDQAIGKQVLNRCDLMSLMYPPPSSSIGLIGLVMSIRMYSDAATVPCS